MVQGPSQEKMLEGAVHDTKDSECLKSKGNLRKILRQKASVLDAKRRLWMMDQRWSFTVFLKEKPERGQSCSLVYSNRFMYPKPLLRSLVPQRKKKYLESIPRWINELRGILCAYVWYCLPFPQIFLVLWELCAMDFDNFHSNISSF